MATNDRAMVEAARRHLLGDDTDIVTVYNAPILAAAIKEMADFAISQSALAVAAERTRVADELGELRSNVVDVEFLQGRLDIFQEQLRADA